MQLYSKAKAWQNFGANTWQFVKRAAPIAVGMGANVCYPAAIGVGADSVVQVSKILRDGPSCVSALNDSNLHFIIS